MGIESLEITIRTEKEYLEEFVKKLSSFNEVFREKDSFFVDYQEIEKSNDKGLSTYNVTIYVKENMNKLALFSLGIEAGRFMNRFGNTEVSIEKV